jgi:hypothetical protein
MAMGGATLAAFSMSSADSIVLHEIHAFAKELNENMKEVIATTAETLAIMKAVDVKVSNISANIDEVKSNGAAMWATLNAEMTSATHALNGSLPNIAASAHAIRKLPQS